MKNNSVTIETISAGGPIQWSGQKVFKQVFPAVRNLLFTYREEIKYCLATIAAAGIFLGSILTFFIQLATYGW